jgi:two-component system LytT family response regulator
MSTASVPKVPLAKDLGAMGPLDLIAGDDFPGLTRDSGFNRNVEPTIQAVMAGLKDSVRKDLRRLLEAEPGVRIAVECQESNLRQMIRKHDPDLLLCDYQVGNFKNLRFSDSSRPFLVFVGSDEKYASRAFELNAVDFLMEPLCDTRVHNAVERVRREVCKLHYVRFAKEVIGCLHVPSRLKPAKHLAFRSKGRIVFLDWDEIEWIEAAANYVWLNSGGDAYLMRESIGRLACRLDPEHFIRIHRSTIVNVHRIKELQPCNSGEYVAVLKNGKQLSCSRGFREEMDRFVSQCR